MKRLQKRLALPQSQATYLAGWDDEMHYTRIHCSASVSDTCGGVRHAPSCCRSSLSVSRSLMPWRCDLMCWTPAEDRYHPMGLPACPAAAVHYGRAGGPGIRTCQLCTSSCRRCHVTACLSASTAAASSASDASGCRVPLEDMPRWPRSMLPRLPRFSRCRTAVRATCCWRVCSGRPADVLLPYFCWCCSRTCRN